MGRTPCALRAAAAVAVLTFASVGAIPSGASAAEAPSGEVKEVNLYFPPRTNRERDLHLEVFPAKGVAVVITSQEEGRSGSARDVSYAIAIPPRPFDGSLDLKFPGLGEFVGTVTPTNAPGSTAQAKVCEDEYPVEGGTFEGRLAFRGSGGYGTWKASRAEAEILPACGVESEREDGAKALFDHVTELGPVLFGPAPIRLFAQGEARHRIIEFIVWGGRSRSSAELVAIDREWLTGDVATERWVMKWPVSLKQTMVLGPDSAAPTGPASATFTLPAPFFGAGTYRRSTGTLTGSLGVNFLGLKLHLIPSPLTADLADEDLR